MIYKVILFIFPLAVWMELGSPSNSLKVFLLHMLAAIFLGAAAFKKDIILPVKKLLFFTGIFYLMLIIPSLYAGHFPTSIIGIYPFYSSSALTVTALFIIYIYGFNIDKKDLSNAPGIIIASSMAVSLYGLAQYAGLDFLSWRGNFYPRIWSTLGNPNFLGAYIAMVIPLTVVKYLNDKRKLWAAAFTLQAAALMLTASRAAMIAAVAGTLATIFLLYKSSKSLKRFKTLLFITVGIILIMGIARPSRITHIFSRYFSSVNIKESNVASRLIQWKAGINMVREKPILGWGNNGYYRHFRKFMPEDFLKYTSELSVPGYPHNYLLKLLINGGIVFAGAVLWFFFLIFKYIYNHRDDLNNMGAAIFGSLAALALQSLFSFTIVTTSFLLVVLLSALIASDINNRRSVNIGKYRYLFLIPCLFLTVFSVKRLMGDYSYAQADFKKAMNLAPEVQKYAMGYGKKLFEEKDYVEAADIFKELAEKNPYSALPYNGLGSVYWQEGRIDEAIVEFKEALAKDPYLVDAHLKVANCYRQKEQYSDAGRHYEKALDIRPDLVNTRYNLGVVYFKAGQEEKAYNQWRKVLELEPEHVQAAEGIAILKSGGK